LDISLDKMLASTLSSSLPEISRRVETDRFGPFVFQLGFIVGDVTLALQRVEDAHERFVVSPLSQVANRLEQEVVVSSVFGTNTIEGGTLSEDETARVVSSIPAEVKPSEQRRVREHQGGLRPRAASRCQVARLAHGRRQFITRICIALITRDLPHPDMVPGVFRDNPKGNASPMWATQAHGGRYKPPQYGGDVAAAAW
jgi:hypothetical protein